MTVSIRRWVLWITALAAAFVGSWALFAPRSWYESFPGLGLRWLPVLGPYNEHLSRDVGALYLALVALTVAAALRPADDHLARVTGVVWLVFGVPHLVFHVAHLDMYDGRDQALNVVSLGAFVVVGLVLLLPVRSGARR